MSGERIGSAVQLSPISRQGNLDSEPPERKPRKERSSDELAAAAGRMLAALERRAAAGDDEAAVALVRLAGDARERANVGLVAAHRYGYSYNDLGQWLGVSRQAVAERIGRRKLPTAGNL